MQVGMWAVLKWIGNLLQKFFLYVGIPCASYCIIMHSDVCMYACMYVCMYYAVWWFLPYYSWSHSIIVLSHCIYYSLWLSWRTGVLPSAYCTCKNFLSSLILTQFSLLVRNPLPNYVFFWCYKNHHTLYTDYNNLKFYVSNQKILKFQIQSILLIGIACPGLVAPSNGSLPHPSLPHPSLPHPSLPPIHPLLLISMNLVFLNLLYVTIFETTLAVEIWKEVLTKQMVNWNQN